MCDAAVYKHWLGSPFPGRTLTSPTSEIDIRKVCTVKISKVMLERHLALFKHFLSSGLHSRVTSKRKEKRGVLGRKEQGRKRGVAVKWHRFTNLWGEDQSYHWRKEEQRIFVYSWQTRRTMRHAFCTSASCVLWGEGLQPGGPGCAAGKWKR